MKILLLGSKSTGKSSVLHSFYQRNFTPHPTIGIEVSSCLMKTPVRFYDMGGARYWWSWIHQYIKNTDLVFLFYDITEPKTLKEADEIMEILKVKKNEFRIILVGNKTDLEEQRKIDIFHIHDFVQKWRIEGILLSHIETSQYNTTAFKQVLKRVFKGMNRMRYFDQIDMKKSQGWGEYIFNWA